MANQRLLFGHAGWYGSGDAPDDLFVAVLLFGAIGGACSALSSPSRFPALARPVLGSALATLLQAVLSGSPLVQLAPAGWLVAAYAAGFAERLVSRPSARRDRARA